MTYPIHGVLWLLSLILFADSPPATGPAKPESLTEDQKIERLIEGVGNLKDATFIRNGTEYDCRAAAEHMRTKWHYAKRHIKTARDFIKNIASASSQSGKPYRIRFKDGTEVNSGDYLGKELDQLEQSMASPTTQPRG